MIPGTPSPERAALHDQLEKVWGNPRGWRALRNAMPPNR